LPFAFPAAVIEFATDAPERSIVLLFFSFTTGYDFPQLPIAFAILFSF
jgi:hypothetical protein